MARTLLHVGCGALNPDRVPRPFRGSDWRDLRYDIDPNVAPDIVGSKTSMTGVATEPVDAVLCAHSLEHLYRQEVPLALAEFWRVLRQGGLVLVVVPDLQAAAAPIGEGRPDHVISESKAGPVTAYDVVCGYADAIARGAEQMAHRSGFVPSQLLGALDDAGFAGKKWLQAAHNIWLMGFKGRPPKDAPGLKQCL